MKWQLEGDERGQEERRRQRAGQDLTGFGSLDEQVTNSLAKNVQRTAAPQGQSSGGGLPLLKSPSNTTSLTNPTLLKSVGAGAANVASNSSSLGLMDILKLFGLNIGTAAVGGALAGKDQVRKSYGDGLNDLQKPILEPKAALYNALTGLLRLGQTQNDKMGRGVKLRTTAQAPPGFAPDPAIADPSLLEREGPETYDIFQGIIPEQFKKAGVALKGQK